MDTTVELSGADLLDGALTVSDSGDSGSGSDGGSDNGSGTGGNNGATPAPPVTAAPRRAPVPPPRRRPFPPGPPSFCVCFDFDKAFPRWPEALPHVLQGVAPLYQLVNVGNELLGQARRSRTLDDDGAAGRSRTCTTQAGVAKSRRAGYGHGADDADHSGPIGTTLPRRPSYRCCSLRSRSWRRCLSCIPGGRLWLSLVPCSIAS